MNNAVYGKTGKPGNQWKTCKQRKRLFQIDIKAKLHATKIIWQ